MIVIIDQETLQAFTRPALDLLTGQIIELDPAVEAPIQLELDYSAPSGYPLDLSRLVTTTGV